MTTSYDQDLDRWRELPALQQPSWPDPVALAEVFETLGVRTASALLTDAWYPAFDVTPPRFVSALVTDRGPFRPADLAQYFATPHPTISQDRALR